MKGKCLLGLLLVLPLLLLALLSVAASGEQTALLDGPSVIAPGEEFTLQYRVGEAVAAFTLELSYDSEWLEYVGYRSAKGWSVLANGEWYTTYGAMNEEFAQLLATDLMTFTFRVKDQAPGGKQPSVYIRNAVLTSAELADVDAADVGWQGTISGAQSGDNTLRSLSVDGYRIDFSPEQCDYSLTVPSHVAALEVKAEAYDPSAVISVTGNTDLSADRVNSIRITVTAENGDARTYLLSVTREKEETHLPIRSQDSRLQALQIEGISLVFAPDQTTYSLEVPASLRSLAITAIPAHPAASVQIDGNHMVSGETATVKITVTAEDGDTRTTYCLLVSCADAQTAPASEQPVTSKPPDSLPAASREEESEPAAHDSERVGEESATCADQTDGSAVTSEENADEGGAWERNALLLLAAIGIALLAVGVCLLCLRRHHDEKKE